MSKGKEGHGSRTLLTIGNVVKGLAATAVAAFALAGAYYSYETVVRGRDLTTETDGCARALADNPSPKLKGSIALDYPAAESIFGQPIDFNVDVSNGQGRCLWMVVTNPPDKNAPVQHPGGLYPQGRLILGEDKRWHATGTIGALGQSQPPKSFKVQVVLCRDQRCDQQMADALQQIREEKVARRTSWGIEGLLVPSAEVLGSELVP